MAGAKLIVLAAFDKDDEGNLVPAFDPVRWTQRSAPGAGRGSWPTVHAGVVAWSRGADPGLAVLFQTGEIPDLE